MGRVEDPQIAKVFKMADRSNDLYQAWVDGGSPGTWGNVQRRCGGTRTTQSRRSCQQRRQQHRSRLAARSGRSRAPVRLLMIAHEPERVQNVIGWGRSAESRMYRVALFGVVQLHASVRIVFTTPLEYVPAIYVLLTLPL